MVPKVTDQFLGKMHGVGGTAPVAAGENLAARFERGDGGGGNLLKGALLGGEGLQRAAGLFNQPWQNGFHTGILASVTVGAKGKKPGSALFSNAISRGKLSPKGYTKILLDFFMGIRS